MTTLGEILKRARACEGSEAPEASPSLAQKDDSAWFQSHPSRSHRFRSTTPAEKEEWADCGPPGGLITHVVIRQISPGINVRKPLNLTPSRGGISDVLGGGYGEDGLKLDFILSEVFEMEATPRTTSICCGVPPKMRDLLLGNTKAGCHTFASLRDLDPLILAGLVKYILRGCA